MEKFVKNIRNFSFKELISIRFFILKPIYRQKTDSYDSMFGYTYKINSINERVMKWWTFIKIPKLIGKLFKKNK
jgi:aminoglycoside N3'-acetyltransferase